MKTLFPFVTGCTSCATCGAMKPDVTEPLCEAATAICPIMAKQMQLPATGKLLISSVAFRGSKRVVIDCEKGYMRFASGMPTDASYYLRSQVTSLSLTATRTAYIGVVNSIADTLTTLLGQLVTAGVTNDASVVGRLEWRGNGYYAVHGRLFHEQDVTCIKGVRTIRLRAQPELPVKQCQEVGTYDGFTAIDEHLALAECEPVVAIRSHQRNTLMTAPTDGVLRVYRNPTMGAIVRVEKGMTGKVIWSGMMSDIVKVVDGPNGLVLTVKEVTL